MVFLPQYGRLWIGNTECTDALVSHTMRPVATTSAFPAVGTDRMETVVIGTEHRWRVEMQDNDSVRGATNEDYELVRITYVDEPQGSAWSAWTAGETWDASDGLYGWTALARRVDRHISTNVVGINMLSANYAVNGPLFLLQQATTADYEDGGRTATFTELRANYAFSVEMQQAFAAEFEWYFNHYGSSVMASLETATTRTHNWFSNTLELPGATDGTTSMTLNEDRDNGPANALGRKYRVLVWTAPVDCNVHQYEED